jgi:DNA-binding transcriptional ArsR family regulator
VSEDLRGNGRGRLEDTRAVFAIITDSDADKGMGWTPTVPPSLTVETSPANFQYWFFLREAVSAEVGKAFGERIRAATKTDHDTGNVVQPYRIAGTVNYPNAKKLARGRVTVPTRIVEFDPEQFLDIEAFPPPEPDDAGAAQDDGQGDNDPSRIPDDTMAVIRSGPRQGDDRSHVFWNVMLVLKSLGFTIDGISALLEQYPSGIALKYRGRLRQEIERVYSKIRSGSTPNSGNKQPIRMISLQELKAMTFEPLKYVVPGVFVEGLTLLAGKPKIGKSWLVLHAGLAVARGGFTLGETHCRQGDVLYLALEDSERRLRSRTTKLCDSVNWPERMTVCCQQDFPRLGDGGSNIIRDWIKLHPEARMVAIDTLAMIRALKKIDESNYQSDYLALIELREIANEFGIAIVVTHHLRKAEADDPFDTISGTLGLTGAVDTMLVLKRDSYGGFVLHGKGRDLLEVEKAMIFDRDSCLWRIEGDAAPIRRSSERTAILDAIAEASEPIGPTDIAAATKMKATNVRFLLGKLVREGAIEKVERGRYRLRT